jgi:hypothetical protein
MPRMRPSSAFRTVRRLAALALVACASSSAVGCRAPSFGELYRESRSEESFDPEAFDEVDQERQERVEQVREMLAEGRAETPLDRLYAAAVLLDSSEIADLELARDLALGVAEEGDERGFPLAARAIDRALMLQNVPQKYGTQYVYMPVTGLWMLYACDTTTPDAERRAMGVPTLAEALAREAELNRR